MKKKAIKIAASTAVAASAFVAAAPVQQADAATNVNQLATDAQNAGTVLKWAISVEGSADFVTRPYNQYNAAKKAIAAAEAAGAKLTTSEKLSLDAKLVDAKLQVKRAGAYIDAITSSEKIKDLTSKLDAAIASGDIGKVEAAYHTASAEGRKQGKLLDRVYGQTTRDEIRDAVKPALEKSVASVKNEVTVNMLVRAAAEDVKAGNIADAHAKVAEAQAIIDANNLKWETDLQKSVADAKTALPAIPGNITVDTVAFHGETGNTYAVVANLKDSKGAAYNGPVSLSFTAGSATSTGAYKFVTVNGVDYATASSADTVLPKNGQLVITVTTEDAEPIAGGKIKFQAKPNGTTVSETTYSGTLNFYAVANDSLFPTEAEAKVKYVDVANKYFVTNNLEKYALKAAGNVYQDVNGALLSLDAFLAKLTAGDTVAGSYKEVGSGSVIQLAIDAVEESEFKINQYATAKDNGIKDAADNYVYRVEGNTVTLSGTGDAGKRVSIYNGISDSAVGSTVIGSNGQWSVNLSATGSTTFVAYQSSKVNEAAPKWSQIDPDTAILSEELVVVAGKFTAKAEASDLFVAPPATLTGETVVFTAGLDADKDETAVIASNASITLQDGYSLSATYTNGVGGTVIEEHAEGFQVKFGVPSKTSIAGKALSGQLSVSAVTGITNAYKFKVEVK